MPSRSSAERRLVSVLFADVVGSTTLAERMDPEDWRDLIRGVTGRMSSAVERYGGTVVSVMGDGILALFGAPEAHEDDAIRAVESGLAMLASATDTGPADRLADSHPLAIRIGVNTGLAIVEGLDAGETVLDALGDTVNVAARMQTAAAVGTVLVTEETWRHVAHAFTATSRGGITVKGKGEPVGAWEIQRPRRRGSLARGLPGLRAPLVGRDDELRRLIGLLDDIRLGRGRAAIVLGDAGVGKSRLLASVRSDSDAMDRPPRWFEARAVSYGVDAPYALLADLVVELIGLPHGAGSIDLSDGLARGLGKDDGPESDADRSALSRLLALPMAPADARALADLSPEALRLRYVAAVERLLRRRVESGALVLVVEDAHWADSASSEAIEHLLPAIRELPILLTVSARPDRASPGWRLVERIHEVFGDAVIELALSPLDQGSAHELLTSLVEIGSLPDAAQRRILERGDGNPLFIEEIVRALIDQGLVERQDERWVARWEADQAEIPDTLRGLLSARVDRLPRETRRVLHVAAVIGRDVPAPLLEDVIGDASRTAVALSLAEAAGLVRLASVEPEPVYRFAHVLIQEATYDSLLRADRRRLHHRVGTALLARYPDRVEALAPTLALHFERAGDREQAVEYLWMAGTQAMASFARREARESLDRAASLLAAMPQTPEIEHRRVEIDVRRVVAGQDFVPYDRSLELITDTRSRAERLGDDRLLGVALAREAHIRSAMGGQGDAMALGSALTRAVEIGRRLQDPEILGEPRAIQGLRLAAAGRRAEAIAVLDEAVDLLGGTEAGSGVNAQLASFYAGQAAVVAAELGRFPAADRMIDRADRLADRSGDPTAFADASIFRGIILGLQGRHAEALASALDGARQAEAIGNVFCHAVGSWIAGEQELAMGRAAPAIEWLEAATEMAAFCRATGVETMSAASLSTARAVATGAVAEIAQLDALLHRVAASGDQLSEGRIRLRRAEANVALASGDPDQARTDLDVAIALFDELGVAPFVDQARRLRSRLDPVAPGR